MVDVVVSGWGDLRGEGGVEELVATLSEAAALAMMAAS